MNEDRTLQILQTATGGIQVSLPDLVIAEDPEGSRRNLVDCAKSIELCGRANVYLRYVMGLQLLTIQHKALWEKWGLEGCRNWTDFMDREFENMTGLSRETGQAALQLARCKTFRAMPVGELQSFSNLHNAHLIAQYERNHGGVVPLEIVEAAKKEPIERFRQRLGKGKFVPLEILVDDAAIAAPLARILNYIKLARADTLEAFYEIIQRAKMRAEDNPDDTLDVIMACCEHQWLQEAMNKAEAVL